MHNFMFQGFSKVDVNTSDNIGRSKVEQENNMLLKSLKIVKR